MGAEPGADDGGDRGGSKDAPARGAGDGSASKFELL
jgi:hypothetical protein